jgi:hypothetical protein
VYKWCAVRCAVVMLSGLAAAVSRRTRQRSAETTKVAVQPPQEASEVQLAQLRARYHLPMVSVAELGVSPTSLAGEARENRSKSGALWLVLRGS